MRQTYRITKEALIQWSIDTKNSFHRWWGELSRRGHLIIYAFGAALIIILAIIIISTYYTAQSRIIYREKIERNSNRIEELEKKNGDSR